MKLIKFSLIKITSVVLLAVLISCGHEHEGENGHSHVKEDCDRC